MSAHSDGRAFASTIAPEAAVRTREIGRDGIRGAKSRFKHAIVSITTSGLAEPDMRARIAGSDRGTLAYWVSSPSYPIYHRALAGRFTRSMTDAGGRPVFGGIFVNSYDQRWPEGFVVSDKTLSPIPTAAWEALREGIDDARFFEAVEQRLARLRKAIQATPPGKERDSLVEFEFYAKRQLAFIEAQDHLTAAAHSNSYINYLMQAPLHRRRGGSFYLDWVRRELASLALFIDYST